MAVPRPQFSTLETACPQAVVMPGWRVRRVLDQQFKIVGLGSGGKLIRMFPLLTTPAPTLKRIRWKLYAFKGVLNP